ncbi:hypothetical protein [Chitinophaga filiformis]|uniref:Uncharacterized protein n=1 Tax=Chitinophaga filiformis TaxID=104663 RepID=A0ABY4I0I2_CHIFI|nr:hypothetical protein [Chitinophaga filiformis]UPK68261.1 hypothetical protein MYF79_25215 [Chitinophaga filiformis]
MSQLHDMTVAYFQATKDYFWQWAEEGEVIEWTKGGGTICYKTELLNDLSKIKNHLPPLGPLLLVIALGKPAPGPQAIQATLYKYAEELAGYEMAFPFADMAYESTAEELKTVIADFLTLLRPLPGRYWKGIDRELLLNTLFEHVETFLQGETAKEMLSICQRGAYDYLIGQPASGDPLEVLKTDTDILKRILQRYPDTDALEKTLNAVVSPPPPVPADMGIPIDLPKPAQMEELLKVLAEDDETALLALLTQRLIAALHLPMHTKGYSQTSFGGVSDITNKGNFDRLLLSELAHDDETLMVRLANNEALYLRREELPENEPGQRFILVDKSIKLWGTPHLLEMAAALACAIDNRQHAEILTFALAGDRCEPMELSSKTEIIAGMQRLSPALNSAKALSSFTESYVLKGQQEYFLITGDELFHTAAFQQSFSALRRTDGFVITVNRECRVQLYRYTAGHRKLLSTAKINAERPAAGKRTPVQSQSINTDADLPAFLKIHPLPLFIPYQLSNLNKNDSFFSKQAGGLAITKHRQLLFWPQVGQGAREITPNFPDAHNYFFGHDAEHSFILFQVKGAEHLSLYQFKRSTHELISIDIKHPELPGYIRRNGIRDVAFKPGAFSHGSFYIDILGLLKTVTVDTDSGKMEIAPDVTGEMLKEMRKQYDNQNRDQAHWQSFNTINSLRHLEINDKGNIVVNKHELVFTRHITQLIKTVNMAPDHSVYNTEQDVKLPGTRQILSKYKWPDGSEAWFDRYRHMLHLRSSDKQLAEITIVLIVNQATACRASDGTTCGYSSYYVPDEEKNIPPDIFQERYIKPFIQVIQQYGTPAVI